MANHALPTVTSTYTNFVAELSARMNDIAMGLDPAHTTVTNQPTNAVRFSSAATKWQKWNGTSWADLAATYAISITGNAGTVTNGVVTTGSYADPSWITSLAGSKISGSISGNAATATTLQTARTINGVSFNGSANISVNLNSALTFNNTGSGAASGTTFDGAAARTISYNTVGAPSTTGVNASGTWNISVTGNAGTASTAATVINGVYVTGDQTIGGLKTFSSVLTNSAGRYTTNNAGLGMYEMHLPGAAARAWYLDTSGVTRLGSTNGAGVVSSVLLAIDGSGNATTSGNISCGGEITATGNITAFSDIRLKQDLHVIEHAMDKVKRLTGYTYTRVDTGARQTGLVAQDVQRVLPEAITEGDYMSLAYGNLAGLFVEAIKELERRVELLEG